MASRAKPNTRENIVMELTAAKDLSRFMSLFLFAGVTCKSTR
jgi:hypothetical protein